MAISAISLALAWDGQASRVDGSVLAVLPV
jgi:hypothetical protein